MFDNLTNNFKNIVNKIRFYDDEKSLQKALVELKRSLLKFDVHHQIVKELVSFVEINTKSLGIGKENFLISLQSKLQDILTVSKTQGFIFSAKPPTIILMVGLQGSGKTTTTGKLAYFVKEQKKKKVLMVATDLKRFGAIEQLKQIGEDIQVTVVFDENTKTPDSIIKKALQKAKDDIYDVVIIDTAGRLAIDNELMEELEQIKNISKPDEIFYVADSMSGIDAVKTASTFHNKIGISGVILTKFDSDSKGGIALGISSQVGIQLRFIGLGEKMMDFEQFIPSRIISRLMGRGDIESLVEKTASVISDKEIKSVSKKIKKGQFNFNDFLNQLDSMKKLGSMKSIIGMIPGINQISKQLEDLDLDNSPEITKIRAMISSMTKKERENPELMKSSSRKTRISKGAGLTIEQLNGFIKKFKNSTKMMKKLSQKGQINKINEMLNT